MAVVAILPAVALVVGAVAGFAVPVPSTCWIAALVVAWLASVCAFAWRRSRLTVVATLVGFAGGGAALAQAATRRALEPAILGQSAPYRVDTAGGGAGSIEIEGEVVGDATPTEFGAALLLEVRRVRLPGARARSPPDAGGEPSSGRVWLTIGGAHVRERIGEWRAGRRIRAPVVLNAPLPYRNFGLVDQEQRLALAGIRLFGSVKSASLVDVVGRGRWWQEACAATRACVRRTIGAAVGRWDARSAAIVTAILIGDRAGLDPQTESRLQRAGTYHVIAISGGNVAILVTLAAVLLRLAGAAPRLRAALAIGIVSAYAAIVGSGASVARATLGAVVYLFAVAIDHRSAAINILGVAVAVIVIAAPLEVIDPAFWLTCVATLAILVCAERVQARMLAWCGCASASTRWRRWVQPPIALLAATMAAESWLLPITAFAFSQVTFAGLVLNFAAIPLMAIAQIGGFVVLFASALRLTPISAAAGYVSHLAAYALVESARAVEVCPQVALRLAPPPLWLVIVAECAVIGWWVPLSATAPVATRRLRRTCIAGWICAVVTIVIAPPALSRPGVLASLHAVAASARPPCDVIPAPSPDPRRWLRLTSLDVAQGDATLLRLPGGDALLIDAGGSPTGAYDIGLRIVSPALWALGLRRLQTLALTHGDRDHIGGAGAVLHDFLPRDVWEGVPVPGHVLLAALRRQAIAQGTRWRSVHAGDTVDDATGVKLRVWNPEPPAAEHATADSATADATADRATADSAVGDNAVARIRNDDSIVLEVRYGGVSIVLPGDIGGDVERRLAGGIPPAPLRILKAAHHGSGRSSTAAFLAALGPRITIVSAGRGNRFGHPAPATLDRYRALDTAIFRTDQDGAIELDTDGHDIFVTTCTGRTLHLTVP